MYLCVIRGGCGINKLEGSFLDSPRFFWKAVGALECLSKDKRQIFGLIFVNLHLIYFCFLVRSRVAQSPVGAVEVATRPNSPYQSPCLCWIVVEQVLRITLGKIHYVSPGQGSNFTLTSANPICK